MKLPDSIGGGFKGKSGTGVSSTGFRDIRINMFREGYAERPRQIGWIFLTALAILAIVGVAFVYPEYDKVADETSILKDELAIIETDIDQFRVESDIVKQVNEIAAKVVALEDAVPEKDLIVPMVELLSDGLPYAPRISSYDLGEETISLNGTTENADTLISYVRALEAQDQFSKANITSLGPVADGGKVEIISKTDSSSLEISEMRSTLPEDQDDQDPIIIDTSGLLTGGDTEEEEVEQDTTENEIEVEVGTKPEITGMFITYLTPPEQEPVRVLLEASVTSLDPIIRWDWDFGDGTVKTGSDIPRIFHDYSQEGDFMVTLTVYDSEQQFATSSLAGMFEKPHAEFTAEVVKCGDPLTVKFTDQSASVGMILQWEWDFDGDGLIDSTETNPTYTFPEPGVYTVSLTVEGTLAQPDTQTKQLTASAPPTADFLATPAIADSKLTVSFTDLSTTEANENEELALWEWDFGDNSTSTERYPTHTYAGMGPYTVSLKVTESDANCNTRTRTINATSGHNASFDVEPIGPNELQLSNTSLVTTEASYLWDFGDGVLSSDEHPTHVYEYPGIYTVTFSIIEDSGLLDLATATNIVTSTSMKIEVEDTTSTPFSLLIERAPE